MTTIMPGAEPFTMKGGATGGLLVHGVTGTPHEMLWLGTQLAADGHTVRGPRLAGHATTPEEMSATRWPDGTPACATPTGRCGQSARASS